MDYRPATEHDIEAIAALHADSWRRHYRGAFSDEYLDGDVLDDRRAVWTGRLTAPDNADHTVVAEAGGTIIGFAHTILDDDPVDGALVDNLHVAHECIQLECGSTSGFRRPAESAGDDETDDGAVETQREPQTSLRPRR